jgi:hypothetical protein
MIEVRNAPRPLPASTGPLRTPEPRGLIDPDVATTRLAGLQGTQMAHVDTSLERIVLSLAADPAHLIVISGPVAFSGPEGPGEAAARELRALHRSAPSGAVRRSGPRCTPRCAGPWG